MVAYLIKSNPRNNLILQFFSQFAASELCRVKKIHEIKSYLVEIEKLVNSLKTELDLSRNFLFRGWLKHQSGLPIESNNIQVPNEVQFLTKQDENGGKILIAQNSIRSNYDKISNQLRELGFSSGAKKQIESIRLNSSRAVYKHIRPFLADLPYECFYLIMVDASKKVVKTVCVSEGGISGTMVDSKKVFKIALDSYCSGILLCHNHPSGNLTPSIGDTQLTKKIVDGGKLLDITVIDHLIIGADGYFSFADEGLME